MIDRTVVGILSPQPVASRDSPRLAGQWVVREVGQVGQQFGVLLDRGVGIGDKLNPAAGPAAINAIV